ncbi:DUF1641 domain-containing protein [Brockia lithotrophica]|uniref:Uncharacterized protein YjgD (DUF1641 family) n=1 Tax=Brockia lithotrophica TaxID=933949 RepID=A0A660KZG1_9BACL|nr:DUF1641 domain-containing protein [Brockia lithotrophica]RKQ83893.1 uncharacterized protein YjgD (DUF1641 family) [Brockia lithotrophica]
MSEGERRTAASLDEIFTPEVLEVLRTLPTASEGLREALSGLAEMQEYGMLRVLIEISEFLATLKTSFTAEMMSEYTGWAVRGVEFLDDALQAGAGDLAGSAVSALRAAREARAELKEPLTPMGALRMLWDPEVREGMTFFLLFFKALGRELARSRRGEGAPSSGHSA